MKARYKDRGGNTFAHTVSYLGLAKQMLSNVATIEPVN
jgi:hypothetical protein